MNPIDASAPQPVAQPKKPRWLLWIGLGCLTILLLAGSCIALGVMAYMRQGDEVGKIAEKDTLAVAANWNVDVLWNRFDRLTQQKSDRADAEKLTASFAEALGPVVEVRSTSLIKTYAGTNGRFCTVRCKVEFQKAIGQTTIIYHWEDEQWMIREFLVDSPALEH